MTFISKTDYVLWRACPKNAWLRIHKPEIYCATELTEFEQSVIDMGIEVECVARGLFPEGVLVPGTKEEAQENTANFLAARTRTLFQPVVERDELPRRRREGHWYLPKDTQHACTIPKAAHELPFSGGVVYSGSLSLKREFRAELVREPSSRPAVRKQTQISQL